MRGGKEPPPRKPNLGLFLFSAPPTTNCSSSKTLTLLTELTAANAVSVHQQREAGWPQAQGFGPAGEGELR